MTWRTASDSRDDRSQRYGKAVRRTAAYRLRVPQKSQESCGFARGVTLFAVSPS